MARSDAFTIPQNTCLDNYRLDVYYDDMKTIARRAFDSLQQEAFLNLWRTYDRLKTFEDDLFAHYDLTPQQYNVLRLLNAAGALPTLVVAERLVSRAPDITRMLDKLEAAGLIRRERSTTDRRTVHVEITATGRGLIAKIAGPLRRCHEQQLGHLSPSKLKALIELLGDARSPHETNDSPWNPV